jgi:hypothetical protein
METCPIAADQDTLILAHEWLTSLMRQASASFLQDECACVGNDGMTGEDHHKICLSTGHNAQASGKP